jgi:hypothetical protein
MDFGELDVGSTRKRAAEKMMIVNDPQLARALQGKRQSRSWARYPTVQISSTLPWPPAGQAVIHYERAHDAHASASTKSGKEVDKSVLVRTKPVTSSRLATREFSYLYI